MTEAHIAIEPATPVEEVVRAVDALRDTCGRQEKTEPCHDRRPLFASISLQLASGDKPAPAPEPAQDTGGLRLEPGRADPTHQPARLQLDNRPSPQFQPLAPRVMPVVPGLHLQRSP